jgi:PEP-CTERM motif
MKKQVRAVLLAAALTAAASTQAATYTGDLLIGFTSQSGNDYIYDLGQASSLSSGQTFNLSGALAGFNLNTVHWAVIGDKNVLGTRTVWTTSVGLTPSPVPNTATWGSIDTATKAIYQNFLIGGSGDSLSISASDDNSWNQQTIVGSLTTQYHNAYEDPNSIGIGSESFYSLVANGSAPTQVGNFSLSANGIVTFTAVPEPSSCVLAGMGLLGLSFWRRSAPKSV